MKEEWRDVKGFEGFYQVSDLGNVRTLHSSRSGLKFSLKKQQLTWQGRLQCRLWKDKKLGHMYVHRMVGMAFIPNPKNLPQINHKNGDPKDNREKNLAWVTGKENIQHAHKNGLMSGHKGSQNPSAKLVEKDVKKIRVQAAKGCTQKELTKAYGISQSTLSSLLRRKTWKHV